MKDVRQTDTRLDARLVTRHSVNASSLLPTTATSTRTTMAQDLSALLTSSKQLTSHLARPDLPSVNLSLDQIEAQSRRLVSRQAGQNDEGRAYVSSVLPH